MEYRQIVVKAGLYVYQTLISKIDSMADDIQYTVPLVEQDKEPVQVIV